MLIRFWILFVRIELLAVLKEQYTHSDFVTVFK